jgi:hypothetical protein
MKQAKIWTWLSLLTLLFSVGCAVGSGTETDSTSLPPGTVATAVPTTIPDATTPARPTPAASPEVDSVPTLEEDTAVTGEVPEAIMTAVYEDLATTQNVSQEAITVTRAEAIIWSDGSLGCPEPGQVYTQALVDGYWIVLAVNGRTYDYHAAETGYFILCQNKLPVPPAGTPTS